MPSASKLTLASDAPEKSLFMLGNEAIARGAIEAGLGVFAAYPGTPSSELSETLINLSKELNFHAEWSVNEKVAFEVAFGASLCNVRSMTAMKMVGLNHAHDPLMSATYMGVVGGMVLVNADDPGIWSSQNEQDNRYIAEQAYLPVLEPSSPQEAKDMTVDAFRLSEQFGQIIMLRSVTRLSHARGDVKLGPLPSLKSPSLQVPSLRGESALADSTKQSRLALAPDRLSPSDGRGLFRKEPRFSCLPASARRNRPLMIQRFNRFKEAADILPYNHLDLVEGALLGIIASGISYSYAKEALLWTGLDKKVSLLKIGTPHPLPEKLVLKLLSSVSEVLVIEELEPFVENHVKIIAQEAGLNIKIHGKDVMPVANELSTRKAAEAISKMTGEKLPVNFAAIDRRVADAASILPARPPTLCAGCPHRASFYEINVVARRVKKDLGERVLTGDIGCYTLGFNPPLNGYDMNCCMGAGFGLANGAAWGQSGPVIGHLGDSTFFHSGIPPLINAVFNQARVTLVILDNSATAMTGFQPHPGSPANGGTAIKPEDIARACNVKFVEVVDPFDVKKAIATLEKAVRFEDGPSVVVMRGLCNILAQRERRRSGEKSVPCFIDAEKCTDCKLCLNSLGCPAFIVENDRVVIDAAQCDGCAVCAQICPTGAIKK